METFVIYHALQSFLFSPYTSFLKGGSGWLHHASLSLIEATAQSMLKYFCVQSCSIRTTQVLEPSGSSASVDQAAHHLR